MIQQEAAIKAASAATTLSSILLAWFGIDHQSLFFGFMGAFFSYAVTETRTFSRLKSVVFIFASTFIGAVFGMAFGSGEMPPSPMSLFLCAVGGSGMSAILTTSKKAILEAIRRALGNGGEQ